MIIISALLLFAFNGVAQDATKSHVFGINESYYATEYNYDMDGDTDSLYIEMTLNKHYMPMYDLDVVVDTTAGADTTMTYQLYGKVFDSDSWSQISTTLSSEVGSETTFSFTNVDGATWYEDQSDSTYTVKTLAGTPYRKLQIRLIRTGDDATGSGIIVKKLYSKLYEPQF